MWVKVPLDIVAIKQDLEDLLGVKVDVVTIYSLSPYMCRRAPKLGNL